MKSRLMFVILACLALYVSTGCSEEGIPLPVSDQARELPLLSVEQGIGMITGFNASNPSATEDSLAARWEEALDAGMKMGRIQIDWPELEPSEGAYDKAVLENALRDQRERGLQPFLLISAYDSEGPVVPEDLDGMFFNDTRLINRFYALMDWVIPMLIRYDGWAIAIANEPGNSFADRPYLPDNIITFQRVVRGHIHQIDPRMAVTITLSAGNVQTYPQESAAIIEACDLFSVNLYGSGLSPMNRPYTQGEIDALITQMLSISGDLPIVVQELGMHANSDLLNSSEEIQRAFFETFFQRMQSEKRIRAAFVFQLVDWSPETIDTFNALYESGVPQSFIDQYSAVLASIGLIDYETGTRRRPGMSLSIG